MKNNLLSLLLLASFFGKAQYYYKDILGTIETSNLIKTYMANKVKAVSLKSFDSDGAPSNGFFVEQTMDSRGHVLKTTTRSGVTDESILSTWFDESAKVIKTTDTSSTSINIATYSYDAQGRLASFKSYSGDSSRKDIELEDHQWSYNTNGQPVQMLRIINSRDTTVVKFVVDENGNIAQETAYKKGKAGDPVYYYYNDKKQLTDIVRYNYKLKKLLPDYMFEYSESGQIIQKITVPSNKASEYLIWRYQYDSKGLKIKEALFNKDKQVTGKIEYNYQYGE